MKIRTTKVNNLLKMRTAIEVSIEIDGLETVKRSLLYYLASYMAVKHSECVPVANANLAAVKASLGELYAELEKVKAGIANEVRSTPRVTEANHSASEQDAIMLFNSDKRFTITE